MIDLHVHTNYSDGTWNVEKMLSEAENAGIKILSITDHDTLKAYEELERIDVKKIYGGKIVTGVEISTVYDGFAFHMLAYDFDYKKIQPWIIENYENKVPDLSEEFRYMYEGCKKQNIKIDDNINYKREMGWPAWVIHENLKKYDENRTFFTDEEWEDPEKFYHSCISNKSFPAYVDFGIHYPNAKKAADIVREAGGKVFIAHLFKYGLNEPIEFLDILKDNNVIDGVEVYHSYFTEKESEILEDYCKKNNLLMSGGTDCHGDKKKERKIGVGYGNMNITRLDWLEE